MATEAEIEALTDKLETAVLTDQPRKVEGVSTSVEAHSLRDQLEVLKHVEKRSAARRRLGGIRVTRMISPGAT